jgi:transposase
VAACSPCPRPRRPRALRPGSLAIGGDPRQPVGAHRRSKRGGKGYDAGKKITGRKRHILTDTDGRLLAVRVHGADVQDRDGGKLPLKASRQRFPFVAKVFADCGYAGRLVHWAASKTHIILEIIRRGAHAKGFEVLPRRWVVERTFAWIFKNRRLVRDYEQLTAVAETLITIAASATLLRRWP